MNDLFGDLATDPSSAPALKFVGRMAGLSALLRGIDRQLVGIDTIPCVAFLDPLVVIHGTTLERRKGSPQVCTSLCELAHRDISGQGRPTKGCAFGEGERRA